MQIFDHAQSYSGKCVSRRAEGRPAGRPYKGPRVSTAFIGILYCRVSIVGYRRIVRGQTRVGATGGSPLTGDTSVTTHRDGKPTFIICRQAKRKSQRAGDKGGMTNACDLNSTDICYLSPSRPRTFWL